MCPCDPISAGSITTPPPSGLGGFSPQLPTFDIPFPELPIEDLLNLFNTLNMILPPGILRPNLSANYSKDVLDAILSLLEKFMPFLMMYTFFMPILNMILCIIEIICALMHPFKLIRAIKRLFRTCIPEFLALFPFFALILMILSLLLLILALIIYLIEQVIDLIKKIIANIELLANAIRTVNNDSIIAITTKLGDLLCIFQNLFVLLGVIILIFQVIEQLLKLIFKIPPCDDGDNSDDGCCTSDVCPGFIKNNRSISANTGTLNYLNTVIKVGGPAGPVTIRKASLQFYDALAPVSRQFNNITHPQGVNPPIVFFPEGAIYTATSTPSMVPYTIDVRFFYDAALYNRPPSPLGKRFLRVKDCIVLIAPVDGVSNDQNVIVGPFTGTLFIAGGTAFEDDGTTLMRDGLRTIDAIIHNADILSPGPMPANTMIFSDLTYEFKINHSILITKSLITIGCHPDVAFDKNFINNTIAAQLNANGEVLAHIVLPDVKGAQDGVIAAVNKFRQAVSVDTAQKLQDTVVGLLTDLQNQTNKTIEEVIDVGVDPFKSDFELDPPIQFTTKPINVVVSLNESSGHTIASNLPAAIGAKIAAKVSAHPTFGEMRPFAYDGSSKFVGQLTSDTEGNGTITVGYLSKLISILHNPANINETPSVTTKELLYTFVKSLPLTTGTGTGGGGAGPGVGTTPPVTGGSGSGAGTGIPGIGGIGGEEGAVRRDETDVSREGGDKNGD